MNRAPFEVGEWYHCYSRGVDKRKVFQNTRDTNRFVSLLYLSNSTVPIHISDFARIDFPSLTWHPDVQRRREEPLIDIGAYCIMPNHVHFVIREIREGGISRFMQKVFTGYTMYFNKKNDRSGALFSGTFKSKHVVNDEYLQHVVRYVHMNPAELCAPRWKMGEGNIREIQKFLERYTYSSYRSFENERLPERALLGPGIFEVYEKVPLRAMLEDAQEYYAANASWQG